jgi:multiple sugar transport system ATP-binding protein
MIVAMPTDKRIELRGVAKTFGGPSSSFVAVEQLDLVVKRGEFVVLLGPSGCGKTTTLRMIAGLESPTRGRVLIDGLDVTLLPPGRRDIAFVFQMFALYPHLSVEENVAFPLRAARVPAHALQRRVDEVIDRLDIDHLRQRKPRHLSGGDQQRVSLARAMVRDPKAFLMDEPLGTLDADQRERTREQLRAIHNELGATTVFVTHDQLEAMGLADRIAVMNEGKLLQYDTPRRVYEHPADLFVAHFIGSPGMNFLPTMLAEDGAMTIAGTTMRLHVQQARSGVRLGIRPEYVTIDPSGTPATVEHTELLGSYNLVALKLGGTLIKARVPAHQRFGEGEQARVRFDPAGCRWFDVATGKALDWTTRSSATAVAV